MKKEKTLNELLEESGLSFEEVKEQIAHALALGIYLKKEGVFKQKEKE